MERRRHGRWRSHGSTVAQPLRLTDSHCNSHIVTSCVFVLVLHSHHKSIGGRLLLFPQAARDGLALCHLSRQDTSRGVPSLGRHQSKQEPRLTAGAMGRLRVKEGPPWSRGQCLCSCVTLPSQDQPLVDARAGHHPRVGAAQEEEVWRRRAL